jgi:hypothetical protein
MNKDKLRTLAMRATPGPWFVCQRSNANGTVDIETGRHSDYSPAKHCEWQNAEFIAAANPEAVLELLDEIDGLIAGAELAALRFEVKRLESALMQAESKIKELTQK